MFSTIILKGNNFWRLVLVLFMEEEIVINRGLLLWKEFAGRGRVIVKNLLKGNQLLRESRWRWGASGGWGCCSLMQG